MPPGLSSLEEPNPENYKQEKATALSDFRVVRLYTRKCA